MVQRSCVGLEAARGRAERLWWQRAVGRTLELSSGERGPALAGLASLPETDRRTIMNLQKRDLIATGLVAAAGVLYLLWLLDAVPTAMSGVRVTGTVILVLGFLASASAVVPTFGQLLHGNKEYLAMTSLIGLGASVAGVVMLVSASEPALAVVMFAMIALWLIATVHHTSLAKATSETSADQVGQTERPQVTV
jgi:hypothetical protein